MNTIQEQFESFKKDVIKVNAPSAQMHDMRIAFYGGAGVMLMLMKSISDKYTEDVAAEILTGIDKEIETFFKNGGKP